MAALKGFFFSICAASFLVSVIQIVFSDSQRSDLLRLACGLILILTVLSPLRKINAEDIARAISKVEMLQLETAADFGVDDSALVADIIREKSEAYILDKAAELGFTPVEVSIEIAKTNDTPFPCKVEIRGRYTQDQRMELTLWIEKNLGVEQNSQIWKWE